jgi:hypothetical protein
MGNNKKTTNQTIIMGILVITSAIIWGLVIIGTSYALKGSDCYDKIQNYLVGGVLIHILLIGGVTPLIIKKQKDEQKED